MEYPYTRKTQGRVRNLDADGDETLYSEWIYKISASISDITLDLWGGTALGLENDTLDIFGIDPLWQDDGRIVRWVRRRRIERKGVLLIILVGYILEPCN